MRLCRLLMYSLLIGLASLFLASCTVSTSNSNSGTKTVDITPNGNSNSSVQIPGISREEFERNRQRFENEAKDLGRKVGSGADDLWIWTRTRAALAYTSGLRDTNIDVDVDNGAVTLSGTASSEAQKIEAGQVASSIEGVKSVTNNVQIASPAANTNATGGTGNRNAAPRQR